MIEAIGPAIADETEELPTGEIGELIVRGPQVSPKYLETRVSSYESRVDGADPRDSQLATHNSIAKISDGDTVWHRMGDVGYLDDEQRFWYCGRKAHRVETSGRTLFTIQIEAIVNRSGWVEKSALVGIGGESPQIAAVVYEEPTDFVNAEDEAGNPAPFTENDRCRELLKFSKSINLLASIEHFLPYARLPTDVRHNSKINREQLAAWATEQLSTKNN